MAYTLGCITFLCDNLQMASVCDLDGIYIRVYYFSLMTFDDILFILTQNALRCDCNGK